MRGVVLAIMVLGCSKGSPPEPETARSVPPPSIPDAAIPPPVADAPPPIDAASPPDAPLPQDRVRGTGTCKVDDDCIVTGYQEGCCVQACGGYATSKQALAARQAKEDCAAFRASGMPCPPPAPCPVPTHRTVGAACVRGTCYSVREKLAP